jgi:glycine hydroxymethyltransferase
MSDTFLAPLSEVDPEVAQALADELGRQRDTLEMIASENFVPRAVLEAQGSVLTNKYAEGYPGRRYYGGCEFVDVVETLAIERAKSLFGAAYANVQPHSGASANAAVLAAIAKPGDRILGLELASGGHLTHGMKLNFSGKLYEAHAYGVDERGYVDMDDVRAKALEIKPAVLIAGWSAYPRELDFARFREIADEVGAKLWVDAAHFIGLVAGQAIPSPVPYADVVTFTTHKVLRGPRGGMLVSKAEHAKALDKAVFPFLQGGPLMHAVAGKAVALAEAATPDYQRYARQVIANAQALTSGLETQGMRAISGGTDTHLALLDLQPLGVTGKEAEARSGLAGITLNKNAIPYDPQPPMTASGIRVGSPSITTQGMTESEMGDVARLIASAVTADETSEVGKKALADVRDEVTALVSRFPAYPR